MPGIYFVCNRIIYINIFAHAFRDIVPEKSCKFAEFTAVKIHFPVFDPPGIVSLNAKVQEVHTGGRGGHGFLTVKLVFYERSILFICESGLIRINIRSVSNDAGDGKCGRDKVGLSVCPSFVYQVVIVFRRIEILAFQIGGKILEICAVQQVDRRCRTEDNVRTCSRADVRDQASAGKCHRAVSVDVNLVDLISVVSGR